MRLIILIQVLLFVLSVFPTFAVGDEIVFDEVSTLSINSAITPATYDYLKRNVEKLPRTSLILIKMNTPGGLVSTTKDIITLIGREKRPIVVWITPEGASAASAGSIIASAAHFIFMSPATNMGAATPVGLGEDLKESDGKKKAMNDLTALVRSLSASRNRPHEPFEKMITAADSYTDKESLKLGIINGIISHEKEIPELINGKTVIVGGAPTVIKIESPKFQDYEPSMGQKIFEVLANPSTAYILFLIGVALIYFEFQAAGGFIAGSIGVCCLILAGMAFQVLPLDWGSMGLIVAGIVLLVLELYVTSYGLLGLAGVFAFVMGSLFLFHGDTGFISVQYSVIFSSLAGVFVAIGIIAWYLWKDKKRNNKKENFFLPVGATGTVLTKLNAHEYQVKVRGEIWRAFSDEELNLNDSVEVNSVETEKLIIKIKKSHLPL